MDRLEGPFVIEVDGAIIRSVSSLDRADGYDRETELTALPGYIDCHDHMGVDVGDEHAQSVDDSERIILRGVRALAQMTKGGVTTVRDCGERADVEPYWVEALEQGVITGPRIIRSVTPICRTGGHAWYLGTQADGPDALRAAVRRNVRQGAQFIKVMATGGMGTVGSSPETPEFTSAELHAVVDEAHRLGRKVAAHAHGGQGVDDALDAGVDSIEHGCLLEEKQLRRMVELGTTLTVTMGVGLAFETDPEVPEAVRAKAVAAHERYWMVLAQARQLGVTVALGSDCMHGGIAQEMSYLVQSGFTAQQALAAGTAAGARLIGRGDLGHLKSGYAADIVLVDGDPIADITAAQNVRGVMCAGQFQMSP
jgi:imidazolonepropionase-like amidohydrolase